MILVPAHGKCRNLQKGAERRQKSGHEWCSSRPFPDPFFHRDRFSLFVDDSKDGCSPLPWVDGWLVLSFTTTYCSKATYLRDLSILGNCGPAKQTPGAPTEMVAVHLERPWLPSISISVGGLGVWLTTCPIIGHLTVVQKSHPTPVAAFGSATVLCSGVAA
jgi:hypothetical protein